MSDQKTDQQNPTSQVLRIPKRKKKKKKKTALRRSNRIIERNNQAEQQNQILAALQDQETIQTTTQTTSQIQSNNDELKVNNDQTNHESDQLNHEPEQPNDEMVDSDDDFIINNAHNTNNPHPSDLMENTQFLNNLLQNHDDNDIIMRTNLNQQQLFNILNESQSLENVTCPSSRHVTFNPSQQQAPPFEFNHQIQNDNQFLQDFNTTDSTQGDIPSRQLLPPPSKDTLMIQALTKIVNQLERRNAPASTMKQLYDILGHDISKFILSRNLKGFGRQRLQMASNRAFRQSKNLAPSQKKVHSLSTVSDVLSAAQTMLAVKNKYLFTLVKKLKSQKNLLNEKILSNTITINDIINYMKDSLHLVQLLFGENQDTNVVLGQLNDIFEFTKISDINYIFPAAYTSIIKSHGRLKISAALDTAGAHDCISKADVSNKLKSQSKKLPPKKSTYLPNCKFNPNCRNFTKIHRSSFYHPKPKSQQKNQTQTAPTAPFAPAVPQPDGH